MPFAVGPFRVTPYLMDHSAFDAHALLVEAGGKRLLYSEDFRGHGRKAYSFERFLSDPPTNVDVLLMEGTTLNRPPDATSERDVEAEAAAIMRSSDGLVLACFSGQNIDRFVSLFRASVRAGRTFILDAYLANIVRALGLASLPNVTSDDRIQVFLPAGQRRTVITQQRFDLVDWFKHRRIYRDEIAHRPDQFTMMFRASLILDVKDLPLADASLIYAIWPGYLERDTVNLQT